MVLNLRALSLVALTAQNSLLAILLHFSRSLPPSLAYSPSSAVLLNEILKGIISLSVAANNSFQLPLTKDKQHNRKGGSAEARKILTFGTSLDEQERKRGRQVLWQPLHRRVIRRWEEGRWGDKIGRLSSEIISRDCWKLGVPAILYVIQNLQFVAASNLDVATFQVTYQLKILTTALCSVLMLQKKLSSTKWLSLLFLSIGVGIVQLASISGSTNTTSDHHDMNALVGFSAVLFACFTSGLAGVYFEMVLKGSKVDLWIRNVQLSLFSLLPAISPALMQLGQPDRKPLFMNFGGWAWSVVICQVSGGLITALVIKYADNILKGFATSLSIVLSFLAGVYLFDAQISLGFLVGTAMVLFATYAYNLPDGSNGGKSGKGLIEKERESDKNVSNFLTVNNFGGNASARSSMESTSSRGTQRHVSLLNGVRNIHAASSLENLGKKRG